MTSNKNLMEIHARVLFKHNGMGRITEVNEPPFDPAPLLYMGITNEGNVIRYRDDIDESTISSLDSAIGTDAGNRIVEILAELNTLKHVSKIWFGPAYMIPNVKDSGDLAVRVTQSNRYLLKAHFPYLFEELEIKEPVVALVADDAAVSICHSARTFNDAAEAGVYTVEAFRGRGFGPQVVKAWAKCLQSKGMLPLYSTNCCNFESQAVAGKLGLIRYGLDLEFQ